MIVYSIFFWGGRRGLFVLSFENVSANLSLIQGYQGTIELKIAKYYLNLGVYDLILFDVVGQLDFICIKVDMRSFNLSEIKFEVYNFFLI